VSKFLGPLYSVQLNIWRMVFQLARRLNIQVFATTHSLDCINAFRRAIEENEGEGLYFRLQARKDEIKAITYEEEELATAIQNDLEVR
jgi:AAA15 family ATPase/GTPase